MTGDVDSVQGVTLDPVIDGILMDSFCQQQGWMRVYGKFYILLPHRYRPAQCVCVHVFLYTVLSVQCFE